MNKEIEDKISQAFFRATPHIIDDIISDCHDKKRKVIIMEKNKRENKNIRIFAGLAASLVVLMASGSFLLSRGGLKPRVVSTVAFDVNPSIEVQVTQDERVVDVIAKNEDGKTVLGDMDFQGSSLDLTVNAIIGSMLRNGYLSEISNSILVSVDNQDPAAAERLQQKLTRDIEGLLRNDSFSGAVLSQTVSADGDIMLKSEQYGITIGKANLIQQIVDQNQQVYSYEDLVPLTVNELNLLANGKLNSITSVGNASDKAYIGVDRAREIALSELKLEVADIMKTSVEMDYEHGLMMYEVDVDTRKGEYEVLVNAVSGEIVYTSQDKKWKKDPAGAGEQKAQTNNSVQNNQGQSNQNFSGQMIDENAAVNIALEHAGVDASNAYKIKTELEKEHGRTVYEIEFKSAGMEYDYEIDGESGNILSYDTDLDD